MKTSREHRPDRRDGPAMSKSSPPSLIECHPGVFLFAERERILEPGVKVEREQRRCCEDRPPGIARFLDLDDVSDWFTRRRLGVGRVTNEDAESMSTVPGRIAPQGGAPRQVSHL
jgi:hypothetical protein